MLQITKEIKSINAIISVQNWPQKCPIQVVLDNQKTMLNNNSSDSDADYRIVATYK